MCFEVSSKRIDNGLRGKVGAYHGIATYRQLLSIDLRVDRACDGLANKQFD